MKDGCTGVPCECDECINIRLKEHAESPLAGSAPDAEKDQEATREMTLPEDAKTDAQPVKPMTLREAKRLASARLRDPNTDVKSVARLIGFLSKHGWKKRNPRKREQTVNDLVQELEAQKRKERVQ